jgi:hypothetical protein
MMDQYDYDHQEHFFFDNFYELWNHSDGGTAAAKLELATIWRYLPPRWNCRATH